jgi:uncharacterized protein (UPF0548 family)
MLRLLRASKEQKERLLAAASEVTPSSPSLLTVTGSLLGKLPKGFAHDLSRSEIGRGWHAFEAAREAFQRWDQFDLGWVRVVNANAAITIGQLVGVEAHTACFWSVNISRVTEMIDSPARFGFLYTTTALHMEEGQERFVLEFDPETESVSYLLEAVSRPRHFLARMAYPFSRAMQHRFARDSHARMRRGVADR